MRVLNRLGGAAVLGAVLAAAFAAPALAATPHPARAAGPARRPVGPGTGPAVFVQTDNTAGNTVVSYRRAADGTLTKVASYPSDGLGGALAGSVVDHLASQGSLVLDRADGLLLAAGSNTVSVFAASGARLALRQVISSGGTFPVSIAVHGDLVYVLNAEDGGSVRGYRIVFGRLSPIAGSGRSLGLNPAATPQYVNTPGQVAFSPDGGQLIVTTKANGNDIDVFGVGAAGYLSAAPAVNSEPGAVPFAITFDRSGKLVIAEAGTNAVATFALSPSGIVTQLGTAATGASATCWVTADGRTLFASNAGSGTVSAVGDSGGALTLLGQTATAAGPVDSTVTAHGRFLYVQTGGAGIVDEFTVGQAGTLTSIGSVTVPGAVGGEGIAAG
jgi:6-phosphogluconolactonase (cycloisomerase 2 family)